MLDGIFFLREIFMFILFNIEVILIRVIYYILMGSVLLRDFYMEIFIFNFINFGRMF